MRNKADTVANATHFNFRESILPLYLQRKCSLTYYPERGTTVGIGQLVLLDWSVEVRPPVITVYIETELKGRRMRLR